MLLLNNAEETASPTTVTTANSGGTNANAFDEVVIGTNMAETFDNGSAANGSNSFKLALTSTATAITYVGWTSASIGAALGTIYGAAYFFVHSAIASTIRWIGFYSGSTLVGRLGLVNGLQGVQWRTQGDAASGNLSGTFSADTWYRCEFQAVAGASGVSTARVFVGNSATQVGSDAVSATGALGGASVIDHVRFGMTTANFSSTSGAYLAMDDLNLNDSGFPGAGPYSAGGGTNWTQNIDDSLSLADALAMGVGLGLSDSVGLADAISLGPGLSLNDSVTLADATAMGVGLEVDDAITVVDGLMAGPGLSLNDAIAVADHLSFLLNGQPFPQTVKAHVRAYFVTKFGFYT